MNSVMYEAVAFGMRYWFILLIGLMLIAMIAVSVNEYRQRKNIIGEVTQYRGYIEVTGGNDELIGTRIGIMDENLIGSSRNADILISHPSIEKNHAQMTMRDGKLFLTPLSGSPTKINGRVATKTHRIFTGDTVTLGDIDFYVFIKEKDEDDDD